MCACVHYEELGIHEERHSADELTFIGLAARQQKPVL